VPPDAPHPPYRTDSRVFVLRCRREQPEPEATPRMHFHLHEVDTENSWRFTDFADVARTLGAQVALMSGEGDDPDHRDRRFHPRADR
jgi:hypothetical protein